jgi:putative ABC transport system substrate-binding protein
MDRRVFLGTLAGSVLLAVPIAARAQKAKRTYRVGTLGNTRVNNTTLATVMTAELRKLGYVVGQNIVFEERMAEGNVDRLPALAAELVRLQVDVIVAGPTEAIRAAHDPTTTIPIVMAFSGDDPVTSGFVTSLARPGGNVTGVTALARDLAPKMMDVLRDAVPDITRIAVLFNPARREHTAYLDLMRGSPPHGVQLQAVEAPGPDHYAGAFALMGKERAQGLVILGDVMFARDSARIAELSVAHRLPAVFLSRAFVAAGGLLAYGPDHDRLLSLAAEYVDRILKGTKPAELPVQQPTIFVLAVNLKTAKTFGLTIPQSLLQRADQVIE